MDEVERVVRELPDLIKGREEVMMSYHNGVDRITMDGNQLTIGEVINKNAPPVQQARKKSVAAASAASGGLRSGGSSLASVAPSSRRDRKRSVGGTPIASAAASSAESLPSQPHSRPSPAQSGPGRKPKPLSYPTHLASTTLVPIRVGLCRHVDRMMQDYGLPPRPTFATETVVEKYNEVRTLLAQLADAKKAVEGHPQS